MCVIESGKRIKISEKVFSIGGLVVVFVLVFMLSWVGFFCLGQRKRFREIYPSSLLAMVFGLTSDILTDQVPYWQYQASNVPQLMIKLLDDFGLYFAVSYLYIQFLPRTLKKWLLFTFLWTLACLAYETLLLRSGHMKHHLGWSLWTSYVADWVLLGILTAHHLWHTRDVRVQAQQAQHSLPEHALLYDITETVCYKDGVGRWIIANDGLLSLLQLPDMCYQGKTDLELAEAYPHHRETFLRFYEDDKKTWESGTTCQFERLIPQPEGLVAFNVTKIPTFDAEGKRKGILVLARRMSETAPASDRTGFGKSYEKPMSFEALWQIS